MNFLPIHNTGAVAAPCASDCPPLGDHPLVMAHQSHASVESLVMLSCFRNARPVLATSREHSLQLVRGNLCLLKVLFALVHGAHVMLVLLALAARLDRANLTTKTVHKGLSSGHEQRPSCRQRRYSACSLDDPAHTSTATASVQALGS